MAFNVRFGFSLQTAVLNHSAAQGWAKSGLPISSAQSLLLPSILASTPLKMVEDCPLQSERLISKIAT